MVSLNTIFAVGGIAAAYIIFKQLGGASGIGSSIGGGFQSFANSLTGSLLNPQSIVGQLTNNDGYRKDINENRDYDEWLKGNDTTPDGGNFVIKNTEPEPKVDKGFDFYNLFPSIPTVYGDTPSFSGQGMISQGYQEPNYSVSGGGFSNNNFFGGGNTTPLSVARTATPQEKSILQSYGIGI